MVPFPDVITMASGEIIRRYNNADVDALHRAIEESREHLHPWMAWASAPLPSRAEREAMFADWNDGSRDTTYGVFDADGNVVAGTGLHDRGGPAEIEIGYWVHARSIGRGLATRITDTLTSVAFDSEPSLLRVLITHDGANVASGRVPTRLGYIRTNVEEEFSDANAESRELWTWEMTRSAWVTLRRA
jgi:RimJ/RimL family protein N-acetyltransferase